MTSPQQIDKESGKQENMGKKRSRKRQDESSQVEDEDNPPFMTLPQQADDESGRQETVDKKRSKTRRDQNKAMMNSLKWRKKINLNRGVLSDFSFFLSSLLSFSFSLVGLYRGERW